MEIFNPHINQLRQVLISSPFFTHRNRGIEKLVTCPVHCIALLGIIPRSLVPRSLLPATILHCLFSALGFDWIFEIDTNISIGLFRYIVISLFLLWFNLPFLFSHQLSKSSELSLTGGSREMGQMGSQRDPKHEKNCCATTGSEMQGSWARSRGGH